MINGGLNRSAPGQANKGRQIKDFVRQTLALHEDTTVLVTELRCSEPECPPLETVIALLVLDGRKFQKKIHQPLLEVTDEHLQKVCDSFRRDLTATASENSSTTKERCDGEH